jgi:hypothetical protein
MANGKPDLRLHTGWPYHPKTRALEGRLGERGPLCLLKLWCYAADNKPSGDLSGMTDDEIEMYAGWHGDRGGFVAALRSIRWLDGSVLHDWQIEQPWAANRTERIESARGAGRRSAEVRRAKYGTAQPPNGSFDNPERLPNDPFEKPERPLERLPNASRTPSPSPSPEREEPSVGSRPQGPLRGDHQADLPRGLGGASRPAEQNGPKPPDSHGAYFARVLAENQAARPDVDAYIASGYTSRIAYLRDKKAGTLKAQGAK